MEYIDLRPCPFCGGEANLYKVYSSKHKYQCWFINAYCTVCGARSKPYPAKNDPDETGWNDEACRAASQAWNRRTGG